MNREELVQELRWSLPNKMLIDVVSFGAVMVNGEMVVLKNRPEIHPQPHELYEFNKSYHHFYTSEDIKGILGKCVLFSAETFSRRGLLAMAKFTETNANKFKRIINAYERFEGYVDDALHKVHNDRLEYAVETLEEDLREIKEG